jgi:hypothetical protein
MYYRQSKSGYRQSKVRQKSMNPKGFRVGGEFGTYPASLVVPFEVEELGNEHILEEASKVLQCEPTLEAITKAITDKWGANAKALWLCDNRIDAREHYGRDLETGKRTDAISTVTLPVNAEVISDLGSDGQTLRFQRRRNLETKIK